MPDTANVTLEERVAELEREVAELRRQLATLTPQGNWIERITGSMKDVPGFDKVVEYGRAIREAERPPQDDTP